MLLRRLTLMAAVLIAMASVSGLWASPTDDGVRVLLAVDRAHFDRVEQAIAAVNGVVHHKHLYVNVIAATIPTARLPRILENPDILSAAKDVEMSLPPPVRLTRDGYGQAAHLEETVPEYVKELTAEEMQQLQLVNPTNFYPYTNALTRTNEFYDATGHLGEGVVIAIIDAGVSSGAAAVASRIVGAEDFTGDGYPANSSQNYYHGTAVACCAGANAVFGFYNPAIQEAVKRYAPSSVIPNYFYPGIDGIPMVGQAPLVSFYALKVFPKNGGASPRSRIAAAIERAIELKQRYNNGEAGGINIQVVNMSIGGANMFAGNDPYYAPLAEMANAAGILLVCSAGNGGPNALTIGTPGDSKNILTVGGTNDSPHYRIMLDLFSGMGPGSGLLLHPNDYNGIASFSSRGPTADGRADPELVAPAVARFMQTASGGVTWANGTSFSAPTVAGAAALLFSAHPGATPNQVRAALLAGANRTCVSGEPTKIDQGFGFLDVMAAHLSFGAWNPPDRGLSTPLVRVNAAPFGIKVIDASQYSGSTGWLSPLQRKEFFIQTTQQPLTGMTVTVSVTAENPPEKQNQIYGDDAVVQIASAKTSTIDYRGGGFVKGTSVFTLDAQDLDLGITRIAILGDWSNAGRIKASVSIRKDYDRGGLVPLAPGWVRQNEVVSRTVVVPPGLDKLSFVLGWLHGWETWPTSDLDLSLYDPGGSLYTVDADGDGDRDGASLDCPERVTIHAPAPGTWTLKVTGFTVWSKGEKEMYLIFSDLGRPRLAKSAVGAPSADLPEKFALAQNYPNPFNPSTTIRYELPVDATVTLEVFDALGERVAELVNGTETAGYKFATFDTPALASGLYFYRLTALPLSGVQRPFVETKKIMLVK
jgi:subtilisin family serine protease